MAETSEPQRLYVDRIEGDMAVLVEDSDAGREMPVPLSRLPEGTKAGQWLTVAVPASRAGRDGPRLRSFLAAGGVGTEAAHFVRDEAAGATVKKRVQSLMDEMS